MWKSLAAKAYNWGAAAEAMEAACTRNLYIYQPIIIFTGFYMVQVMAGQAQPFPITLHICCPV